MSTFNPTQFANLEFEGQLDTTIVPVPAGDWPGVVKKQEVRTTPKGQVVLEVTWSLDAPEVSEVTGRDENSIRQSIWLDITEHGTLDMGKGKNIGLGRLLAAVGLNKPGQKWSFGSLVGQLALCHVIHEQPEDEIYARCTKVAPLS